MTPSTRRREIQDRKGLSRESNRPLRSRTIHSVAIEEDPEFFAGYFAPYSQAGTFAQLAHVETLFHTSCHGRAINDCCDGPRFREISNRKLNVRVVNSRVH